MTSTSLAAMKPTVTVIALYSMCRRTRASSSAGSATRTAGRGTIVASCCRDIR